MSPPFFRSLPTILLLALLCASPASAQMVFNGRRFPINNPGANGTVSLPYMMADSQGSQWMIYGNGMANMQGNLPVFSQVGLLNIGGESPSMSNNMARLDPTTHELTLENMQAGNISITRRILLSPDGQYLRYVDLFTNPTSQDVTVNLQYMANVNFGIAGAQPIDDPGHKDITLGWAGQVSGPVGKAVMELFAGHGAKVVPTVNWPRNSNQAQTTFTLTVPAGKSVALVHLHGTAASVDAAQQWAQKLDVRKLLADLPRDLRQKVVNFPGISALAGNLEILRGEMLDVVELRGGDRFDGNLTAASYPLQTSFGKIDLPINSVIAMVNVGRFHPRQLIVTSDGQIYGGQLGAATVEMELASGQKTQIPLDQIARLGYRQRGAAPSDTDPSLPPVLAPPYVLLSDGERLSVDLPTSPLQIDTRYGSLALPADAIASIVFASQESDVNTFTLTDGSQFHGLLTGPDLSLTLSATPGKPTVKIPISQLQNLVLHTAPDDTANTTASLPPPSLTLSHDDHLAGTLTGQLKLSTAFDTLTLAADQVRALAHVKPASDSAAPIGAEVTITGWDGTTFRGQLLQDDLLCHISAGNFDVHIPVNLVRTYTNPQAQAPDMMLQRIKKLVAELNGDDWKQRDAAQDQLFKLGRPVEGTLRAMRDDQPPEAQQRIDSILAKLAKEPPADRPIGEPMSGPDDATDVP